MISTTVHAKKYPLLTRHSKSRTLGPPSKINDLILNSPGRILSLPCLVQSSARLIDIFEAMAVSRQQNCQKSLKTRQEGG